MYVYMYMYTHSSKTDIHVYNMKSSWLIDHPMVGNKNVSETIIYRSTVHEIMYGEMLYIKRLYSRCVHEHLCIVLHMFT